MIGQLHVDKCVYHAICRKLSYLQAVFIIFRLKSIIKQLLDLVYGFLHLKCIDSVFVTCQIINVSVRVISLAFSLADNSYLDTDSSACISQKPHPIIVYLM